MEPYSNFKNQRTHFNSSGGWYGQCHYVPLLPSKVLKNKWKKIKNRLGVHENVPCIQSKNKHFIQTNHKEI